MTRAQRTALIALCGATLLLGGPALAQKKGGDFVAAQPAGTNTMDPHFTASAAARNMMLGMYETLVTIDENAAPIPSLAASWEIAPDGMTYKFTLRRGVKFHTGKEMTSADVKASLERFAKVSPEKTTMAPVAAIETPDPYTVVFKMKELSTSFIDRMGSPASPPTIIPEEEATKEVNKTNNISTGPFQLVEWVADSHVKMKRFDGYAQNAAAPGPTGLGGKKTAYFDTVTIRIVREASARVAALEAGQVHFIEDVPVPAAKRLEGNSKIVVANLQTASQPAVLVNGVNPPTSNLKLRQAIQAALDIDEIMQAASDGNFKLSHAFTYPNNPYFNDGGKEFYNQADAKKAKALLAESGYKGEPLVIATNKDYQYMFKGAQVISEQLKAVGINVRFEVMDWPTMASLVLNKNDGWNLSVSGFAIQPFVGPYSYLKLFWGEGNVSRVAKDEVLDKAWGKFNVSLEQADRKAAWTEIQRHMAQQVYVMKLGDMGFNLAMASNLKGFKPYSGAERFWDAWLE
ncbi:MAG: ABC transporter substrate-binding protein [Proteobacteria bacterium]|nr:ABC transporter substrate-binding protein [Pseudomonadota bacterium]MBI3499495.1 ABC transporter substrate-binding protein [Pseudomonadota bacterium]